MSDRRNIQSTYDVEAEEERQHRDLVNNDTDENSSSRKKENTRSFIAQLYVWAFFCIIFLVFITGWIMRLEVKDYKDLLLAVSGTLSGPLGFIVGYYFKASKE